ncbi:hypothetical protein MKS88_003481 [Plasmodium brasilianum]|uniref:Uncharacterized protein n=1 Tax=Plasmodium brasilianum TaxID=5824 RepID=A0ACB9Y908_PLABR|nr:hypothetical protein MKS88_003481 [Plasmodium brasilianum]
MVHKIKLLFFIIIFTFILLTWIYHFNSELCTFNKSVDKNYNRSEKLETRCYRILAKYKQHNDSNNVYSKETFTNNVGNNQKEIYKNEMCRKRKNIQSNRSILNKEQYYTEVIDYNNGIFDGKHFHFQKKWIKKKNYDTFLEKKRRICNIALKKIRFRKYRYAAFMLFFFFLLGIGLPISYKFVSSSGVDTKILEFLKTILDLNDKGHAFILLFAVTFIMLSILIIIAIYKILRNKEKYQKFKFMTE